MNGGPPRGEPTAPCRPRAGALKEVQANKSCEEHDARLNQEAMQCVEALVDPVEALVDLLEAPVDPVEALVDLLEAPVDPFEARVDPFEASVVPFEALVDAVEAGFHLPAQGDEFRPRFHPVRAEVGVDAVEAAVDLLVEIVQALVGPTLSHRLHHPTIADRTLRVGASLQELCNRLLTNAATPGPQAS